MEFWKLLEEISGKTRGILFKKNNGNPANSGPSISSLLLIVSLSNSNLPLIAAPSNLIYKT